MRGYQGIDLPLSGCVHFVRNSEVDGTMAAATLRAAKQRGIVCTYMNCRRMIPFDGDLATAIGTLLGLDNKPYPSPPWVPFLDDLITLSTKAAGLIIIVDNAYALLDKHQDDLFDLVEAFLIQFHHWFDQSKPCHLCLQMERNDELTELLSSACESLA